MIYNRIENTFRRLEVTLLMILYISLVCSISVSAAPRSVNCSKTTQKVMQVKTPSFAKNLRGQDSYVDRGVLFKFWGDNALSMYNFKTGKLLRECKFEGGHCGAVSCIPKPNSYGRIFSNHDAGGNVIYISQMNGMKPVHSRILRFPEGKYGYHMKLVVDPAGRYLYGIGYKNKNRRSPANGNCMIISVWDLRSLKWLRGWTYTPKFVRSFKVPFVMFCQGMCFYKNKIYLLSSDYVSPDTKVYAVDVKRKAVTEVYQNFPAAIRKKETQGVFVNGGYLYIDDGLSIYRVAKVG